MRQNLETRRLPFGRQQGSQCASRLFRAIYVAAATAGVAGCSSTPRAAQHVSTGGKRHRTGKCRKPAPRLGSRDRSPTDVYTRIARGALTCWFGAAGPLKGTHIYHAEAAPASQGDKPRSISSSRIRPHLIRGRNAPIASSSHRATAKPRSRSRTSRSPSPSPRKCGTMSIAGLRTTAAAETHPRRPAGRQNPEAHPPKAAIQLNPANQQSA